ncbi:MAG TPA: DUF1003 domain-containing protein [Gammaproteobacteria bacterium]|nr:DUF1003 domain-containing protein [Gammaproteobacteria bacterium]
MDDDELAALAGIFTEESFRAGQTIFREGQTGDRLYVIDSGQVAVSLLNENGDKITIDIMGPGDYFGEMSLFDGGPRSATVTSTEPTKAFTLGHDQILELLMRRPHMAQDVIKGMVRRFRRTGDFLRRWTTPNPNEVIEEKETFGNRIADRVAQFGGSWTFIGLFAAFLFVWTLINSFLLEQKAFDPYPYILLNLFLSMLAAIQAPVIMMSQNRTDAKDRIRSELDYKVNLKAELEITELLKKVDNLEIAIDQLAGKLPVK